MPQTRCTTSVTHLCVERPDVPSSPIRDLELLYRDHHRRVRWILRARGIGDHVLDDAVHDVFVAAHRRLPDRDPELPLGLWLLGIARNVAFSHRRGNARRTRMLAAIPEPPPEPEPDLLLAERDAWSLLRIFLTSLRSEQREAFVLIELVGMDAMEVSQIADVPLNTVYSRLRLARRRFRERFGSAPHRAMDFLRSADEGESPSADARERAWMSIAASVARPTWPAMIGRALASGPALAVAGAMAVGVTTSLVASAVEYRDRESFTIPKIATTLRAEPILEEAKPSAQRVEHAVLESPRLRSTSTPHVVETRVRHPSKVAQVVEHPDALGEAVELLREAEHQLALGEISTSLAAIDRFRQRFAGSPLWMDLLKLEQRAACADHDTDRASSAMRELSKLRPIRSDNSPCP